MPPETSRARKKHLAKAILAVVVLAFVACAVLAYLNRAALTLLISAWTIPADLKAAMLISPNGPVTPGLFGYTLQDESMLVSEYVRSGDHVALISSKDPSSRSYSVTLDGKTVVDTETIKSSLALAADGARLAFSKTTTPSSRPTLLDALLRYQSATTTLSVEDKTKLIKSFATNETTASTSRNLVIYDAKKDSSTTRPGGFAPHFIDATHLVWFSQEGIMVTDLSAATDTLVFPVSFPTISVATTYSSKDSEVAYVDTTTGATTVVHIEGDTATKVASFKTSVPTYSIALNNGALYTVTLTKSGTKITRYAISDGTAKNLFVFPASLRIYALQF